MSIANMLLRATVSGGAGAALSTFALAALARREGKGAAQPINATSHWLYGDGAANYRRRDLDHTAIGYVTHHAATTFWAMFFETSLKTQPPRSGMGIVGRAAVIGGLAAIVDYTVTPKRFTPGWELVLSKRAMAGAYTAMALGFACTALVWRPPRR